MRLSGVVLTASEFCKVLQALMCDSVIVMVEEDEKEKDEEEEERGGGGEE